MEKPPIQCKNYLVQRFTAESGGGGGDHLIPSYHPLRDPTTTTKNTATTNDDHQHHNVVVVPTTLAVSPQSYDRLLMIAAGQGHGRLCESLLAAGASANSANASGWTVLHAAVGSGSLSLVQTLLAHGADPTATNFLGSTVLHAAVRALRHTAASPSPQRKTAPQEAMNMTLVDGSTRLDICRAILAALDDCYPDPIKLAESINAGDADGRTALHLLVESWPPNEGEARATKPSLCALAQTLCAYPFSANVNAVDDRGRSPVFMAATEKQSPELVRVLLACSDSFVTNIDTC